MENKKFAIIEICEREVLGVMFASSSYLAIVIANELLREHCYMINRGDDYEKAQNESISDPKVNRDDIQFATSSSQCAWCNFKNINWDAHIVEIKGVKRSENNVA